MPKPTAYWHQDAIKDLKTDLSVAEIARKYRVSHTMISKIAKQNGIEKKRMRKEKEKLFAPLSDQHNSIGTRLWRSRVDLGLTLSDYGARIGINSNVLSKMQDGQYDFNLSELQRILPLLGLSLEIKVRGDTTSREIDPDEGSVSTP